jgi:hypothetical protein
MVALPEEKSPTQIVNNLLSDIEPMIEQVNTLYRMFAAGVERLPPTPKRSQLQRLVDQLMAAQKPTPTIRFRVGAVVGKYNTMKEKWDKLMKDIESGKVQPFVKSGPRRPG